MRASWLSPLCSVGHRSLVETAFSSLMLLMPWADSEAGVSLTLTSFCLCCAQPLRRSCSTAMVSKGCCQTHKQTPDCYSSQRQNRGNTFSFYLLEREIQQAKKTSPYPKKWPNETSPLHWHRGLVSVPVSETHRSTKCWIFYWSFPMGLSGPLFSQFLYTFPKQYSVISL